MDDRGSEEEALLEKPSLHCEKKVNDFPAGMSLIFFTVYIRDARHANGLSQNRTIVPSDVLSQSVFQATSFLKVLYPYSPSRNVPQTGSNMC